MVTRTIPKPILAALVLPLVVIVGFQSAWAAYACRVDGRVRSECCCKPPEKDRDQRAPADGAPRMAPQGCCDVTIREPSEPPVIRETDGAAFASIPVVVPAIASVIAPRRIERAASIATMARPPPRIPLFLDKQALLR